MKKLSKVLSILLIGAIASTTLTACNRSNGKNAAGGKVTISLLNSKGGVYLEPLQSRAKKYEAKTGVKIQIMNTPDGGSPFERISAMYNAGNPPTIAMLDTADVLSIAADKAVDLSDEKWNSEIGDYGAKIDGKTYGFPLCVEGKGILYNKTLIEKTLGSTFDPSSVKNLKDFTSLLDSLQAKGMKAPIIVMKEDWSLGSHFLQYIYESQGKGTNADSTAFIEKLKAGNVDLTKDTRFNEYMDTFDTLAKYNYKKIVEGNAMGGDNVRDAMNFAEGKSAFYFNGNWVWADLKSYVDSSTQFGIMPYPINSTDGDFANDSLQATASKQLMIDKVKATPEQQKAAKDFISWIVNSDDGKNFITNEMNLVSPCKNNSLKPSDPLSQSVKTYSDNGKTFAAATTPSDHWSTLGAVMQKYLSGKIDRAALATEIQKYWTSKAGK